MRMWNLNPRKMCKHHLRGEHLEMHMFAGCLRKGKSLDGYIRNSLVNISLIKERHDALAKEIIRRGWKHDSPMRETFTGPGVIDPDKSLFDLTLRCEKCRQKHFPLRFF